MKRFCSALNSLALAQSENISRKYEAKFSTFIAQLLLREINQRISPQTPKKAFLNRYVSLHLLFDLIGNHERSFSV